MRDKKQLLFYFLFPIFLVMLLGNVLAAVMSEDNTIEDDNLVIYYLNEGSSDSNKVFQQFYNMQDDLGFKFQEVSSLDEGKKNVRLDKGVYLQVVNDKIEYYSNEKRATTSTIIYEALKSIVEVYNSTISIYRLTGNITADNVDSGEYFEYQKISEKHSPSSMEYYGVAELGLMSFYFITYALFSMKNDERKQIKDRIRITGIKTYKYYLGKVIGNIGCCYFTILSAYLVLRYILQVNYGSYLGVLPIALLVFVTIAVSIGTLIGVLVKDEGKADTILMSVVIPVLSFLGGGYIVLDDDLGLIGNFITRISPLRTFNKGVLGVIYGESYSNFIIWILGGLAVAIIINIIIILASKRKEGLYE